MTSAFFNLQPALNSWFINFIMKYETWSIEGGLIDPLPPEKSLLNYLPSTPSCLTCLRALLTFNLLCLMHLRHFCALCVSTSYLPSFLRVLITCFARVPYSRAFKCDKMSYLKENKEQRSSVPNFNKKRFWLMFI